MSQERTVERNKLLRKGERKKRVRKKERERKWKEKKRERKRKRKEERAKEKEKEKRKERNREKMEKEREREEQRRHLWKRRDYYKVWDWFWQHVDFSSDIPTKVPWKYKLKKNLKVLKLKASTNKVRRRLRRQNYAD